MEVLYLLVPLALALIILIVVILIWAVRSGQYDDLEGPAHRILMDDDAPHDCASPTASDPKDEENSNQPGPP